MLKEKIKIDKVVKPLPTLKVNTVPKTELEKFTLLQFLVSYLPTLDSKIPTKINEGGCGIFAKHLYIALNRLGFDTKIVFIGETENKDQLTYLAENNKIKGKRFGVLHCLIALNDYIFLDSDGVQLPPNIRVSASSGTEYFGELSIESLDTLNHFKDAWNDMFDVKCEKDIEKCFSTIEKDFEDFQNGKSHFEIMTKLKYSEYTIRQMKNRRGMGMNSLSTLMRIMGK